VVPHPLDDRVGAAVAHAEALAGQPADVRFPAGRPVESDVAGDDVLLEEEAGIGGRIDHQPATRQALAEVVVGVALELEGDPLRDEGHEALARRALEVDVDGIGRQPLGAVAPRDLAAEARAHGAIHVANGQRRGHPALLVESEATERNEAALVELVLDAVPLRHHGVATDGRRHLRPVQDGAEVDALGLPVVDRVAHLQALGVPHRLLERTKA